MAKALKVAIDSAGKAPAADVLRNGMTVLKPGPRADDLGSDDSADVLGSDDSADLLGSDDSADLLGSDDSAASVR
jgi:hypothetical protein